MGRVNGVSIGEAAAAVLAAASSLSVTTQALIAAATATNPVAAPSGTTLAIGTSEIVVPENCVEFGLRFKLSGVAAPDVDVDVYAFDRGDNGEWLLLSSFSLANLELEDDYLYSPLFSDPWKHAGIAVRMVLNSGVATMNCDAVMKLG